jgi:prevent-host-death family protein
MAYTVHQAKTNFSKLLKQAEAGEEVIVMRGKKPVAKITAVEQPAGTPKPPFRYIGAFEGLVHADDSAFDPLTDEELVEYGFGFMLNGNVLSEPDKALPDSENKSE